MAKIRLAPGLGGLSGRLSNVVFVETRYGTVMRDRPFGRRQRTNAQQQIGRNLSRANKAWRELTETQVRAWQLYCLDLTNENTGTGLPLTPHAPHVFLGYATKILQMNPDAVVPTLPPATPFYGDSLRVTLEGGRGEFTVTASAPNAPGVTTEVLVQSLRHWNNTPQPKSYRTAVFRAFANGQLSVAVPKARGVYAVAIRFVDTASGRMTTMYPVGKVRVTD